MTKRAFDKIAAGLREAAAINRGEADPGTYRVHTPTPADKTPPAKPKRSKKA